MKLQITIDSILSQASQKDLCIQCFSEILNFDDEIINSDYAKFSTIFGSVEIINPDYCQSVKISGWYQGSAASPNTRGFGGI